MSGAAAPILGVATGGLSTIGSAASDYVNKLTAAPELNTPNLPPMPNAANPNVQQAALDEQNRARGRAATILTGTPGSVGLDSPAPSSRRMLLGA